MINEFEGFYLYFDKIDSNKYITNFETLIDENTGNIRYCAYIYNKDNEFVLTIIYDKSQDCFMTSYPAIKNGTLVITDNKIESFLFLDIIRILEGKND